MHAVIWLSGVSLYLDFRSLCYISSTYISRQLLTRHSDDPARGYATNPESSLRT